MFMLAWVAVALARKDELLGALSLAETELPDDFLESDFAGAATPAGAYVVASRRSEPFGRPLLELLSGRGWVIRTSVGRDASPSESERWENGRPVWRIWRDRSEGPLHLVVEGQPPAGFAALRERALQLQEKFPQIDCLADAPLDLAEAATGFRHDRFLNEVFPVALRSA